jgi:hypothetical protein
MKIWLRRISLLLATIAFPVLLVVLISVPTAASAGLFGSIGSALGIGGDVGNALNFADGLLPGGGGPTDEILGAPGKAAFGEAINKWSEANEKSIKKLGETNDRTVAKLLQGLDGVVNALQAGLASDIDAIDASLSSSIATLDDSLEKNIEKLDNSLTDQTQRLDTVFQKQTSTFFFLGRVLLTVIILGGLVFSAFRTILDSPDMQSLGHLFAKRRGSVMSVFFVAAVALGVTWLVPDPGRLTTLENRFSSTYDRSIRLEDFTNAQQSASQLTVLRPDSSKYRSWNIKAAALRDLVLRPTILGSEDRVNSLYVRLGQVNEYRKEDSLGEDPDVLATYALIGGLKAKRELDYVAISIAFRHALDVGLKSNSSPHYIAHLVQLSRSTAEQLRLVSTPLEMLRFALMQHTGGGAPDSPVRKVGREALVAQYAEFIAQQPSAPGGADAGISPATSLSSFTELFNTLRQKLLIRSFYQKLTAKYFAYLYSLARAAAPGTSAQTSAQAQLEVLTAYCNMNFYYRDWAAENYPRYGHSLSFVANLLSGPFVIISRAQALNKIPNACQGYSDADMKIKADIIAQWLTPLTALKMQQTGKGATLLKASAKLTSETQNAALNYYESSFSTLKDIQDVNINSLTDPAVNATKSEAIISLAELSAILGIYAEQGNEVIPAVFFFKKTYKTGESVSEDRWRRATLAFLEGRFGG